MPNANQQRKRAIAIDKHNNAFPVYEQGSTPSSETAGKVMGSSSPSSPNTAKRSSNAALSFDEKVTERLASLSYHSLEDLTVRIVAEVSLRIPFLSSIPKEKLVPCLLHGSTIVLEEGDLIGSHPSTYEALSIVLQGSARQKTGTGEKMLEPPDFLGEYFVTQCLPGKGRSINDWVAVTQMSIFCIPCKYLYLSMVPAKANYASLLQHVPSSTRMRRLSEKLSSVRQRWFNNYYSEQQETQRLESDSQQMLLDLIGISTYTMEASVNRQIEACVDVVSRWYGARVAVFYEVDPTRDIAIERIVSPGTANDSFPRSGVPGGWSPVVETMSSFVSNDVSPDDPSIRFMRNGFIPPSSAVVAGTSQTSAPHLRAAGRIKSYGEAHRPRGLLRASAASGKLINIKDIESDSRFRPSVECRLLPFLEGCTSVIYVPVFSPLPASLIGKREDSKKDSKHHHHATTYRTLCGVLVLADKMTNPSIQKAFFKKNIPLQTYFTPRDEKELVAVVQQFGSLLGSIISQALTVHGSQQDAENNKNRSSALTVAGVDVVAKHLLDRPLKFMVQKGSFDFTINMDQFKALQGDVSGTSVMIVSYYSYGSNMLTAPYSTFANWGLSLRGTTLPTASLNHAVRDCVLSGCAMLNVEISQPVEIGFLNPWICDLPRGTRLETHFYLIHGASHPETKLRSDAQVYLGGSKCPIFGGNVLNNSKMAFTGKRSIPVLSLEYPLHSCSSAAAYRSFYSCTSDEDMRLGSIELEMYSSHSDALQCILETDAGNGEEWWRGVLEITGCQEKAYSSPQYLHEARKGNALADHARKKASNWHHTYESLIDALANNYSLFSSEEPVEPDADEIDARLQPSTDQVFSIPTVAELVSACGSKNMDRYHVNKLINEHQWTVGNQSRKSMKNEPNQKAGGNLSVFSGDAFPTVVGAWVPPPGQVPVAFALLNWSCRGFLCVHEECLALLIRSAWIVEKVVMSTHEDDAHKMIQLSRLLGRKSLIPAQLESSLNPSQSWQRSRLPPQVSRTFSCQVIESELMSTLRAHWPLSPSVALQLVSDPGVPISSDMRFIAAKSILMLPLHELLPLVTPLCISALIFEKNACDKPVWNTLICAAMSCPETFGRHLLWNLNLLKQILPVHRNNIEILLAHLEDILPSELVNDHKRGSLLWEAVGMTLLEVETGLSFSVASWRLQAMDEVILPLQSGQAVVPSSWVQIQLEEGKNIIQGMLSSRSKHDNGDRPNTFKQGSKNSERAWERDVDNQTIEESLQLSLALFGIYSAEGETQGDAEQSTLPGVFGGFSNSDNKSVGVSMPRGGLPVTGINIKQSSLISAGWSKSRFALTFTVPKKTEKPGENPHLMRTNVSRPLTFQNGSICTHMLLADVRIAFTSFAYFSILDTVSAIWRNDCLEIGDIVSKYSVGLTSVNEGSLACFLLVPYDGKILSEILRLRDSGENTLRRWLLSQLLNKYSTVGDQSIEAVSDDSDNMSEDNDNVQSNEETEDTDAFSTIIRHLRCSCAAVCVQCYVLGLNTLSSDKLTVTPAGVVVLNDVSCDSKSPVSNNDFHIDEADILHRTPQLPRQSEPSQLFSTNVARPLLSAVGADTPEMSHVQGHVMPLGISQMVETATEAFMSIRRRSTDVVSMAAIYGSAGAMGFTSSYDIACLRSRLLLHLSEDDAAQRFRGSLVEMLKNGLPPSTLYGSPHGQYGSPPSQGSLNSFQRRAENVSPVRNTLR